MPFTGATLTITTTPQAVIAQSDCTLILIKPDPAATVSLKKQAPSSASQAITYPVGVAVEFIAPRNGMFLRGQTVGYISTDSGSMTAYPDES